VTYKPNIDGEFQKAKTTQLSVGLALTSYQAKGVFIATQLN